MWSPFVTFPGNVRIISITTKFKAMRLRITFTECEHNGDLENYADDVRNSGGTIVQSSVDTDAEEGTMIVEVNDKAEFVAKFKETDAYQFVE